MCHFFRLGTCNKGSGCSFSHDLAHPDSFLCPYFLKGTCIYGDKCQYDHRMPVGTASPRSNEASTSASTNTAASSVTAPSSGSTSSSTPKPAQKIEIAGDHKASGLPGSLAASTGTDCVYFKNGSCRFGNQCRFRHGAAQTDSEAAIASLGNQMVNLNTGKAAAKTKAASKASPSGTKAVAGGTGAPAAKKSAWAQRKNRPAAASGLTVYDDNQDTSDPWFRTQNPYLIPERTRMPQVEHSEILCVTYTMTGECSYGEKCPFMHGELCETCKSHCLHPTDEAVRHEHISACAEMLKATEAHARSKHVRHHLVTSLPRAHTLCPWTPSADVRMCDSATTRTPKPLLNRLHKHVHRRTDSLGNQPMHASAAGTQPCLTACMHGPPGQMMRAAVAAVWRHGRGPTSPDATSAVVQKECGICLEVVLSKEDPAARRFGLLACDHCFCLQCIRSWRGSAQADESATRACPTCRTLTFFITPSSIWPQSSVRPLPQPPPMCKCPLTAVWKRSRPPTLYQTSNTSPCEHAGCAPRSMHQVRGATVNAETQRARNRLGPTDGAVSQHEEHGARLSRTHGRPCSCGGSP